jgi:hypothetical protein
LFGAAAAAGKAALRTKADSMTHFQRTIDLNTLVTRRRNVSGSALFLLVASSFI